SMGVKAGVDPLALWKAVRQGATGRRRTFDGLMDKFLPGKYDPPSFALRLGRQGLEQLHAAGNRARRHRAGGAARKAARGDRAGQAAVTWARNYLMPARPPDRFS